MLLAVTAVAAPVVVYLFRSSEAEGPAPPPGATQEEQADRPPPSRESDPDPLQPGENVTKQRLAQVSADGFYWDLLRRQMTQPIGLITSAYFRTPAEFEQRQSYFVKQLAIDHRTGDFTSAQTSYVLGRMSNMSRCIDGKSYFLSRYGDGWSHLDSNDEDCATIPQLMHSAATDGIVTSGLSDEQAGKVLASLRDEHEGFAHPRRPTLITVNGKTYIRQVVDYTPVKLDDGLYWGTRIFTRAFTETGLDPKTWPWYAGLGPGEGLHVVYYIDTKTLLPVASVIRSTPVLDENGRERERYDQTMVFNYGFPAKLPVLTVRDARPLRLTLPEGWRIAK